MVFTSTFKFLLRIAIENGVNLLFVFANISVLLVSSDYVAISVVP